MSTIGAEMDQLQSLKGTFDRESQNVNELTSTISGQIGSTWWKGPAADNFRSSWDSQFAPMLRNLEQQLQQCSQEIQRRHDALQQAGT